MFNTPIQIKQYNSTSYFILNLTKMLLYFNKSGSASKKKNFQVHIHLIRFPSTLTFLFLGANIFSVHCKQIIVLLYSIDIDKMATFGVQDVNTHLLILFIFIILNKLYIFYCIYNSINVCTCLIKYNYLL